MTTDSGDSTTLGKWMTERRTALRITKAEAARRADVGRMTWSEWEADRRTPYDANYAGIEHALQWATGSVEAIVTRAGTPVALPPGGGDIEQASTPDQPEEYDKEKEFFRQVLLNLDRQGVPRPVILLWANEVTEELRRRKTHGDEQDAAS